jgi:hypothetical protein
MKPPGIKLRSATDRDAEGVARLVDAAYEHYTARIGRKPMPMTLDYGDEIRRKEVTVAEEGDEVVGVLVLDTTDEGFVIFNVAVLPTRQGRALDGRFSGSPNQKLAVRDSTRSICSRTRR